ncbi:DUF5822 domain-containing protein [Halanaeroarchaeum sulfurireducens]|uniref:DUF5822 domain-containing protein n=1 Tax=Halanaeroarchaeum sulfurireducens TaxID=1604004 RepID=UPI0006797A58|nr:DUF5822 domain-containing protein [Halanaeroarchaeum sulfurireducens]
MPEPVESTEPTGVDYGWVLQVTFVLSIVVGAPLVVVFALWADLPTWSDRLAFAVRVGAFVWLVVSIAVFAYARLSRA